MLHTKCGYLFSECEMNFSSIMGPAGSGKTYTMRERATASGENIRLTATTGVAALNMGPSVTTINSLIGFFDVDSLMHARKTGRLARRLQEVSMQFGTIAIDEISMMPANVLDCLIDGFLEVEHTADIEAPDLLVLGDFCQLPPVEGSFAFNAHNWHRFDENTTKLEGSYRQKDHPEFFAALQHARAGRGVDCVLQLRKSGVTYRTDVDIAFDGLTITPLNASVNKINRERYDTISTVEALFPVTVWGEQQSDWKQIPATTKLKVTARVMILANKRDRESGELEYVNGDSGVVAEVVPGVGVKVLLDRNGAEVYIPYVKRTKLVSERGVRTQAEQVKDGRWLVGWISYLPVRLAYASSVHKAQGLTLNKVQIDTRTRFAGEPGMMYTALSRVRAGSDIVIVSKSAGDLARRINTHAGVRGWV